MMEYLGGKEIGQRARVEKWSRENQDATVIEPRRVSEKKSIKRMMRERTYGRILSRVAC
jgi:hypothetical protein